MGHSTGECGCGNNIGYGEATLEQISYVGNQFQGRQGNNPYSNTYNPGWRNHPNSWSNNNNVGTQGFQNNVPRQAPPGFQQNQQVSHPPQQDRLASMESKLDKFFDVVTMKMGQQDENQKRMEAKFDQIAKNHSSSIHNIEVQMGQIANAVAQKNQGNLPSNTEPNPREQLKVISLRSVNEI